MRKQAAPFWKIFCYKDAVCIYYDKSCDSHKLFEDLAISRDNSFERHLNKYNVIYLDITLFIAMASDIKNVVMDMEAAVVEELRQMFPEVPNEQDLGWDAV